MAHLGEAVAREEALPVAPQGGPSSRPAPTPVAVVSPVRVAREALRDEIEADPTLCVLHAVGVSDAEISALGRTTAQIVVLDGSSPDGLGALTRIRRSLGKRTIVVFGVETNPRVLLACARNHVTLVADRDASGADLREIVHSAAGHRLEGAARLNAALLAELAALVPVAGPIGAVSLTQRERQVASALADGLTNKEIARELCISLATVKSHVHNVLQKLHITGRREILRGLRELGEM